MLRSSRSLAAVALAIALAAGHGTAAAQTSAAEKADKLNKDGQDLFGRGQYDAAAQKFREAILFSAEGRFYFNLCYTLNKMSKYRDAITACEAVAPNGASTPLQEKAQKLLDALRAHVANTSEDPNYHPPTGDGGTGTGDGGTGDGGTGTGDGGTGTGDGGTGTGDGGTGTGDGGTGGNATPPPAPAAGGVVEQAAAPPPLGQYKWSLGGELMALGSSLGDSGNYASGGVDVNLHADFLLSEARGLGVRGYLGITTIGKGDFDEQLEVFDIGAAGFKHMRLNDHVWITGVGGVHIALMRPDSFANDTSVATLGFHGEAALSYLLGSRGQHVLSVTAGFNVYTPAAQGAANFDPADYGLDKVAGTYGVGIGYTMRFATPFGSTPVFTLE